MESFSITVEGLLKLAEIGGFIFSAGAFYAKIRHMDKTLNNGLCHKVSEIHDWMVTEKAIRQFERECVSALRRRKEDDE